LDSRERCTGPVAEAHPPGVVAPSECVLEPGLVIAVGIILARAPLFSAGAQDLPR
jgi:hypothetical protein